MRKIREEENGIEALRQELERERCRNMELEQKLHDINGGRSGHTYRDSRRGLWRLFFVDLHVVK